MYEVTNPFKLLGSCMKYRHYKGGVYDLIGEAILESDLTPMIVYRAADGRLWIRPQTVFLKPLRSMANRYHALHHL